MTIIEPVDDTTRSSIKDGRAGWVAPVKPFPGLACQVCVSRSASDRSKPVHDEHSRLHVVAVDMIKVEAGLDDVHKYSFSAADCEIAKILPSQRDGSIGVTGRSKPASSNRVKPGHLSGLVHCAPNETLRASSRRNGRRRGGRDQAEIVRLR